MGYFRELPNIEYKSPLANRISNKSYIQAKNLFRRMKIRDDLQNVFTIFNKYVIKDGAINVEGDSKKLMYDESVKESYLGGTKANV